MEFETTKNLVRNETERELDEILNLSVGDELIGGAIVDVSTMGRLLIDMEKAEADISEKQKRLKFEEARLESEMAERIRRMDLEEEKFKYEVLQNNEQRKYQWIRIGLDVFALGIMPVITLVNYNKWVDKGFIFEKEGALVSQTFRNMFSKFKSPLKK